MPFASLGRRRVYSCLEKLVQPQLAPERQPEQRGPQLARPLQSHAVDQHLRHVWA